MSLRLSNVWLWSLCLLLALAGAPSAGATPLTVTLDLQGQGLAVSEGGVGMQGIGTGTRSLTVDIPGPVQAALLYWVGRDRPCPMSSGICVIPSQPYKDQVIRVDGVLITGTIIGTEMQPTSGGGPINNIGYLADITSLVQAKGTGLQTFALNLGGAKILLRAAVAALLNAGHSGVDYPRTTAEILADVNAALSSGNRNTMLALATALDDDNNLGCPLH
jgi:hypothetical protein